MKKLALILITSISILISAGAQNVDDALRYSQIFYSGTARFNSMGGAFTALGGDLSALSLNPAGLGLFRSSEISITPQLFNFKSSASLFGSGTNDFLYNFNLGQAGIVANIINNEKDNGLISLNFGYSYNKLNNYNQSITLQGKSTNSSLLDYFAWESDGYTKGQLADKVPDAFLAWDTWLIDTLSGSSTQYGTIYSNYGDNLPSVYGQTMKRIITTTGYTGEHALSVGGNYSNKLYFGATLGITRLSYSDQYQHSETTDASLPSKFTDFSYNFYFHDYGTGYNVKFGLIYKPIDILRIGFAFHSPTYFRINEEISDNITSYFSDRVDPYKSNNSTTRFQYALTTPFRADFGAALQIKKLALLSADYEYVNYATARFSQTGDGYDYSAKNSEIKNTLQAANNLRLGAEVRLNNLYLRGGYAYYGKAFNSSDLNSDLHYNSISLGVGFRERNIYADLGFSRLSNSRNYIVYDVPGLEEVLSNLDLNRNVVSVTFGYKFGY